MEENIKHATRFKSVLQANVPRGRDGKHKAIVTELLTDIAQLDPGSALRIPLTDLPDSKENIRAALSRSAAQKKIGVATSSDETYLYIWKTKDGTN